VGVNVTAPGQSNVSGGAYLAQTPETNSYDADGNLTRDGRWTYTWDAENRLISMTSLPNAPLASQYSLSFAYDYMGRRIQKIVSTNSASGYVPQYTNVYVYDGWNLIGVLTPQSAVVASMMWGLDLSGSLQGAGGVGGLLAENLAGNGAQFVVYDGAGNVSALVSATNGAVTATYEYGPFGELTRATGQASKLNEVMYQSQICDWESGKYYWKYRYYDTSTGRWLNHDPIGENGGMNLYGFVGNNPVNRIDLFGLAGAEEEEPVGEITAEVLNALRLGRYAPNGVYRSDAEIEAILREYEANTKLREELFEPDFRPYNGKEPELRALVPKRSVPNPWGRKGGPCTQKTTEDVIKALDARGFTDIDKEVRFEKSLFGVKDRFADLVGVNPQTGEALIINIGNVTQSGIPIMRERLALDDIIFSTTIVNYPSSRLLFIQTGASGLPPGL
jgi:RHS repeat-associated protein